MSFAVRGTAFEHPHRCEPILEPRNHLVPLEDVRLLFQSAIALRDADIAEGQRTLN